MSIDTAMRRAKFIGLGLCVFVLALSVRLWGINNGLPTVQRPDESADITQSLQIVRGQVPQYAYHRVIWSLVQIPLHTGHFALKKLLDPSFGFADFEASYFIDRASFVLSARIFIAIFGALATVLVGCCAYLLSKRWQAFVIAGIMLAFAPMHSYLSHIALPDIFATFCVALCCIGAIAMMNNGGKWAYIVAGIGASMAILGRLQSLPLVIGLVAFAHFVTWWQHKRWNWQYLLGQWLWAATAFFIAQIIFNPYIILNTQAVIADLEFIFTERFTGTNEVIFRPDSDTYTPFTNIQLNLRLPFILLRWYMLILFVIGTVLALFKRRYDVLAIAAITIVFILSLLPSYSPRITYWLPAIIPFSIVIGWGLDEWFRDKDRKIQIVGAIMSFAVLAIATIETLKISFTLAQADTQSLAYEYVQENIPANSHIMIGDTFIYSVPLPRSASSIERAGSLGVSASSYQFFLENPDYLPDTSYDIYGYEFARQIRSDDEMRAFLSENNIEYVIEADYCGGIADYDLASGLTYPVITLQIREELSLVYTVSPFGKDECLQHIEDRTHMEFMRLWDWQRVGPIIRIYTVPN